MSAAFEVYNLVKDLVSEARKRKDIDLTDKLLDIQSLIFEIREENEGLKKKIQALEEAEDLTKDLELTDKGVYIRISEKEQGRAMDYCPACYVDTKKLYPIVKSIGNTKQCSKCNHVFR